MHTPLLTNFIPPLSQNVTSRTLSFQAVVFNTDYGSSEPLKTLVMLCYVMLSRIYNWAKPGNRPIDNAATAILHYTFRFTTAQIVINCTLKYDLHYITFSLTCGLRTVYLINLKNLICVDIVKMSSQVLFFTCFLHRFLTNLASTGGPHEISRRAGRMRPAGWTALQ